MLSLPQRPRPGRRRLLEQNSTMSLFMVMLAFTSCVFAFEMPVTPRAEDSVRFKEVAERGEIHIDTRSQPLNWLDRRQVFDSTSSEAASTTSSPPASSSTAPSSSISTNTPTSVSSTSPSVTVVTTPLPSPFDTSLGSNFTSPSCPQFFTTFLSNSTFRSCTPVSLLLQTSTSFFRAMRSSLLTATLSTACSAPLSICNPIMTDFARQLLQDSSCGQDFRNQQPLVLQAYNGLIAYEPVYRATCLTQQSSSSSSSSGSEGGEYCFSTALNSPNPADIYPYFTAVGLNLPAGSKPSCTPCLKQTMQVFAQYAVRKEQPLAQTYLGWAREVDSQGSCGVGFAETDVQVGSVDSGLENGRSAGMNGVGRKDASWEVLVAMVVLGALASL